MITLPTFYLFLVFIMILGVITLGGPEKLSLLAWFVLCALAVTGTWLQIEWMGLP